MSTKDSSLVTNNSGTVLVPTDPIDIQNLIYMFREQQVMLDSDLAMLYQVETKYLNRAVKRNIDRFPEDFCFQLSAEEFENLKCQIGTSSLDEGNGYGGRRTRPYVFTEQGISMLSGVLHSDVAVAVSIKIMRAFVEMRHFIASNTLMFERISAMELRQLEFQKETNEKFDRVFEYISDHAESEQKVFFDGQIYDAFSLISGLIQKATTDIILIDGYVDTKTLDLLSKKQPNVAVEIFTGRNGNTLTKSDIGTFNKQYPSLQVKYTNNFHDRFLILDHTTGYHIGASIKDAGKKCFAISLIEDSQSVQNIMARL